MINYVFDTNCIISGNLLPDARQAYNKALKQVVLLYSSETLSELTQVFTRPKFDKYVSVEDRIKAIAAFENVGFLTEIFIRITLCRDTKDDKFLELANAGNAAYIITGDKDLLLLNPFQNIAIISPADFVNKH